MATVLYDKGTHLANLAVSAFRFVVLSNNGGITYATNAQVPDGLVQLDAASGDYVTVRYFGEGIGTCKCALTSAPVTVGDTLYAGALGRISTTGTITVGKSLTTASTNDQVIEFLPKRAI